MKEIAVFFGGKSNEHEISVITGMYCVNLLRGAGFGVSPVYLSRDGDMYLALAARGVDDFRACIEKKKFPFLRVEFCRGGLKKCGAKRCFRSLDGALNACHGGAGEDGTLSALFSWYGIRSLSPNAALSSAFMDKSLGKIIARGLNVPVLRSFTVREDTPRIDTQTRADALGYPLVVKPCRLGSSIGISVARKEDELFADLKEAFALDESALVEEYLPNRRDLNCAACCIGEETVISPVEEVFSDGDILSFGEKYASAVRRASCLPAEIPSETSEQIRGYLKALVTAYRPTGIVRGDFFYADGQVYFNELNTVPGSLALHLFSGTLTGARKFLSSLIERALSLPLQERRLVTTGILSSPIFAGSKRLLR